MVLCSRPFVFQICNCQSTSLLIFWSSVIQLHRLSTHSQQVNDSILKFKYKFNLKIVTGLQTNKFLSFLFCFWSHIAQVCAALLSFGHFSPLLHYVSKRDNEFIINIDRLFKLLLGFMYKHTQSQNNIKTIPWLFITFFFYDCEGLTYCPLLLLALINIIIFT